MSDNRCTRMGLEDDALFQRVVLQAVFREKEPFEVRKDIEIPNNENSNGAVISFDDGRIGYFKVQSDLLSDDEYESILEACYFLQDKFGGSIVAYILCRPEVEIRPYEGIQRDGITLMLTGLLNYDGDAILEMLENKRRNGLKFTPQDHVFHIILPFMSCRDRETFLPKYQHYMMETMLGNAEKYGIEVVRL